VRPPLAYAPGRGPLSDAHALAASAYLGSIAIAAFVFSNPIVLAGAGAAATVAGLAVGARRALRLAVRWGLALAVVFVVVNALAAQRGDTILLRGGELPLLGHVDVSAEALVEGAILAMRVVVVMMVFAVHSATVDPDRLLRLLRPVAGRSALTASLLTRLVPVAAADHDRLREAASLRGPGAAAVGRAAMTRRLVAGSLDRAVDVAATLELRGYALGVPRSARSERRSRHSIRFLLAAFAITVGSLGALAAGIGEFEAYPRITIDADAATLALAAALPCLAALPFIPSWVARARRRRQPGASGPVRKCAGALAGARGASPRPRSGPWL
jgi:energy-coupling factor transport system permease protein